MNFPFDHTLVHFGYFQLQVGRPACSLNNDLVEGRNVQGKMYNQKKCHQ